MKFSSFFILFSLISLSLKAQTDIVDLHFKDFANNANFSTVFVSPKMFQMITKSANANDSEVMDVLKDLKGLKILRTEVKAEQMYADANKRVQGKGYEELLTVREQGSQVRFLTKEKNNVIEELVMIVGNKQEFSLISFVGKIDLAKLSRLAKKLDFKGAEHLDKISKK